MKVLEGRLKRRLNPQTVVNAYLHFDALSDHSYHYNCLLCGYHPTTLIMDLNKKVSFACNMSDMELILGKGRTINDSEGFPWSKLTGARRQPKPSFLVSIYWLIDEEKFIAIEYGTSKG